MRRRKLLTNLLSRFLIRLILKKLAVFSVLGGTLNETPKII
nr:MAG TPA: hypothetical protein [Microviridae sp.]